MEANVQSPTGGECGLGLARQDIALRYRLVVTVWEGATSSLETDTLRH